MADIAQVRKCYNCGTLLQSEDPNKEGYVRKEILENAAQNFIFCDRCFENEKYHARPNEPRLDDDFLTMLTDAKAKDALIVYVVNLFSFEASFIEQINNLIKGNKILAVANKRDLLPMDVSEEEIKEYVAHRFRAVGLKAVDVMVTTGFDDEANRKIINAIQTLREGKDTYVIGQRYCGKTTLVNAFLRVFTNLSKGMIITRNYRDTNLRVMAIPLDDHSYMFDTPGTGYDNSLLSYFDDNTIDLFLSSKAVEKKTIRLSKGSAVCLGGYAMVEYLGGESGVLTADFYFRPQIQYRKIVAKHGKTNIDIFCEILAKGAISPRLKNVSSIKDLDVYEVHVEEARQRDIGILGFGWISFIGHQQVFRFYVPSNVSIYNTRAKVLDRKLK